MIKVRFNIIVSVGILIWISLLVSCLPESSNTPINYIINGPQDLYPAFSPDGQYVAYYHDGWYPPDPSGYPTGLYIINKDGSNRRLVLLGDHYSPSWSPDGEWIVFSSDGVIQKCKTKGDSLIKFSELDTLRYPAFFFPDWSSDGEYILFDNPFVPDGGLYQMTFDFKNVKRILGFEEFGRDPELSPNGSYLVYFNWVNNSNPSEIFIRDTTGNKEVRLTQNNRDDRDPTWSPDGKKIAWNSNLRLSIINADGTNQHEIGYGNNPSWSVNDKIVFSHANSDFTKELLYIIDPDGKNRRQITF